MRHHIALLSYLNQQFSLWLTHDAQVEWGGASRAHSFIYIEIGAYFPRALSYAPN